ncbi:hypothetical protein AXG93_1452s1000 [Marchantia polymorpha subsp. ruderalis]|uniref:Uncharacterized protein n=3 Tax=Marchantia polymorpha TaxID=3197 RepID=A0A176WR16_MARPO|nr:hypothetical protein AXG93_1452s1000 [Marchantia polymorpha subsp. ruderalis]
MEADDCRSHGAAIHWKKAQSFSGIEFSAFLILSLPLRVGASREPVKGYILLRLLSEHRNRRNPIVPVVASVNLNSWKMAKFEKNHLLGLLVLIVLIDFIVLAIAGWGLDEHIDGTFNVGNGASFYLIMLTLVAGMVVLASAAAGLLHFKHFRGETLSGASSLSLLAWFLMLLAFGVACKAIDLGGEKSKMKALEAFVLILTFFQTAYVAVLHAGIFNSNYGLGY